MDIAIRMLRYACLAAAFALTAPAAGAASEDFHSWNAVVSTIRLDDAGSWRAWLEGQARFNDDASRFNQAIVRGAIGRTVAPRTSLWAGYAWIPNNRPLSRDNPQEHRVWQQLLWRTAQPLAGWSLSTRTRLEQRTIEGAGDLGWRFRQLAKLTHPLGSSGRWYASLWDEVMVHLNDTDWGADGGFDQNRAFAGIGWRPAQGTAVEVGYMNQYVNRRARSDASNHVVSVTLLLNF